MLKLPCQVVVDTNILVRALLKPSSSDGLVFQKLLNGDIILFYSLPLIKEIVRVLYYPRIYNKYHLNNEMISVFIKVITTYGKLVNPQIRLNLCRDKDDNELLSIASSIKDKETIYIITADKDLLVLKGKIKGINILTPANFLRILFTFV